MLKFFELIYSTSGCVGRATWWWTQLITLSLFVVLGLCIVLTSQRITRLSTAQGVAHDAYLQSLPMSERHKEKLAMVSEDWNIMCVAAVAMLLIYWVNMVIEVKRWHDIDFSGYCVLLRFLPALAHGYLGNVAGIVASIVVPIGTIYFLGFRPGVYDHSHERDQPSRSFWTILNEAGAPVILIILVVAAFKFGAISKSSSIRTPPPSLFPPDSESNGNDGPP